MKESRLFDYFVVAGLPEDDLEELKPGAQECGYKDAAPQAPITDICIIFPSLGEQIPDNFTRIETTPSGHPADLNHGSIRTPSCYLCYRRGYHKPPLIDIGVLYQGKERVMVDSSVVQTTPFGRDASVNNSSGGIYLTWRRAPGTLPSILAVTDICVILKNKNETPPHTFCQVNKNLNKGFPGSDVFICYKKTLVGAKNIPYRPRILDRFPRSEHPDLPLPPNLAMFCLPMGANIECWPAKCQSPGRTLSTFVLTNEQGLKYFGTCVSFWEPYEHSLTPEQLERLGLSGGACWPQGGSVSDTSSTNDPTELCSFQTNKCICIISKYPFFTAFKRFLLFLHRMIDPEKRHAVPLERYIAHLMFRVPFPSLRRPRVQIPLGPETISFENPEKSQLPISGASFIDMLKNLGPDNSMYLLLLALTEHKILLHSLRPHILTSVAESVTSIIFPFRWQCPYIPQCPLDLAGVLHAPLPFIVGVDSRYFELYEHPPPDVTCFDIDTNTISCCSDTRRGGLKLGMFPKRPAKVLKQSLEALCRRIHQADWNVTIERHNMAIPPLEKDYQRTRQRRRLELEIQEAFLVFLATLLKGYRAFLKPIKRGFAPSGGAIKGGISFHSATDTGALFGVQAFLRSRDRSSQEFTKLLLGTQIFSRFIEERSGLGDQHDPTLVFFDQCIEKIEARDAQTGGAGGGDVGAAGGGEDHFLEDDWCTVSSSGGAGVHGGGGASGTDRTVIAAPPEPDPNNVDQNGEPVLITYSRFPSRLSPERFFGAGESLEQALLDRTLDAHSLGSTDFVEPVSLGGIYGTGWRGRTTIEARSAMRIVRQLAPHPLLWAKCCLSFLYWFVHLSAFVKFFPSKTKCLRIAGSILDRMERAKLPWLDEYCYRALMQQCFQYDQPLLAVKVFLAMKKEGITPNALTYALYQRAILEAKWPSLSTLNAHQYWAKLRNAVRAITLLKRGIAGRQPGAGGGRLTQQTANVTAAGTEMTSLDVTDAKETVPGDTTTVTTPGGGSFRQEEAGADGVTWRNWERTADQDTSKGSEGVGSTPTMGRTRSWTLGLFHVSKDCMQDSVAAAVRRSLRRSLGDSLRMDSAAGLLMTFDGPSPGLATGRRRGSSQSGIGGKRKLAPLSGSVDDGLMLEGTTPMDDACGDLTPTPGATVSGESGGPDDAVEKNNDAGKGESAEPGFEPIQENDQAAHSMAEERQQETETRNSYVAGTVDMQQPPMSGSPSKSVSPIKSTRVIMSEELDPLLGDAGTTTVPENAKNSGKDGREPAMVMPGDQRFSLEPKLFASDDFENHPETPGSSSGSKFGGSFLFGAAASPGGTNAASAYLWTGASNVKSWLGGKLQKSASLMSYPATTTQGDATGMPTPFSVDTDIDSDYVGSGEVSTPDVGSGGADTSNLSFGGGSSLLKQARSSDLVKRWSSRLKSAGYIQRLKGKLGEPSGIGASQLPELHSGGGSGNLVSSWSSYEFLNWQTFGALQSWSPFHSPAATMGVGSARASGGGPGLHSSALSEDSFSYCCDEPEHLDTGACCGGIAELKEDDPAFQLFSGETGTLMNAYIGSLGRRNNLPLPATLQLPTVDSQAPSATHAVAKEIVMSCSTNCSLCGCTCYEEEIMAGFSPNDSDLNTKCPFCKTSFLPILSVRISPIPAVSRPTSTITGSTADFHGSQTLFGDPDLPSTPLLKASGCQFGSTNSLPESLGAALDSPMECGAGGRSPTRHAPLGTSTPHGACIFRAPSPAKTHGGAASSKVRRKLLIDGGSAQSAASTEGDHPLPPDGSHAPPSQPELLRVNFVSPLVLRKELEDLMQQEGEDVLWNDPAFPAKHSILFWNLLYYFERVCVPTHLEHWALGVEEAERIPASSSIRCVYDLGGPPPTEGNQNLPQGTAAHDDVIPEGPSYIYRQWAERGSSRAAPHHGLAGRPSSPVTSLKLGGAGGLRGELGGHPGGGLSEANLARVLAYLSSSSLLKAVQLLINERRTRTHHAQHYNINNTQEEGASPQLHQHKSIYRDLLFMALAAFGTELDRCAFDREFSKALGKLPPKIQMLLQANDRPPTLLMRACRMVLLPLDVC